MERKNKLKPLAAIVGTTFAVSLGGISVTNASEDPFALEKFEKGYMLAAGHGEGGCGEGKCGGSHDKKGSEGKCGESKGSEGSCGESKSKGEEGKCGS